MKTPIIDFVKAYANKNGVRAHMPGHKGKTIVGGEKFDLTEISEADILYSAQGIIKESMQNASKLFDTFATFYSTQGSTLCIKAMLYLASKGKQNPTIVATRNAHKTFIYGCALLGITPEWVYPDEYEHLCSCNITPKSVKDKIHTLKDLPCAVYITSPDYLGNTLDIKGISEVCEEFDIPLIVDNAHGAYLAFTKENMHAINQGATMCCDSAHKTLPCLTGGAYLHLSKKAEKYLPFVENALSLFASTSPSYLVMQSLDKVNDYIDKNKDKFIKTQESVEKLKADLVSFGYVLSGNEPFKVVVDLNKSGADKEEVASALKKHKIECEFADNEFVVFMFSTCSNKKDYKIVEKALCSCVLSKKPTKNKAERYEENERAMSVKDAIMKDSETIAVEKAEGRICASPLVSCPPAIPIVVSGEKITKQSIALFKRYGIEQIEVVK